MRQNRIAKKAAMQRHRGIGLRRILLPRRTHLAEQIRAHFAERRSFSAQAYSSRAPSRALNARPT